MACSKLGSLIRSADDNLWGNEFLTEKKINEAISREVFRLLKVTWFGLIWCCSCATCCKSVFTQVAGFQACSRYPSGFLRRNDPLSYLPVAFLPLAKGALFP